MSKRSRQRRQELVKRAESVVLQEPPDQPSRTYALQQHTSLSYYSGPLPPPNVLGAYSHEAQAKLLEMAEREQAHRHAIDNRTANATVAISFRAQWMAFILASIGLGLAGFGITKGQQWAGVVSVIIAGIGTIVALFLRVKTSDQAEPQQPQKPNGTTGSPKAPDL